MSPAKYRRTRILVDKRFQLGISLKIVVCLACYLVLFCLMAFLSPLLSLLTGSASAAAVDTALNEVGLFVRHLILPLVLTFTCLALHCILLSHRVAGPAYRFMRTFEAMRDGDLSVDVHLRRGDYLTDVADSYNEMIGTLRAEVAGVQDAARELETRIRAAVSGERASREDLERLAANAAALRESLGRLRIEPDGESGETPAAGEGEEIVTTADARS